MNREIMKTADFAKTFGTLNYSEGVGEWWFRRRVHETLADLARKVDSANDHARKVFREMSGLISYIDFYQWVRKIKLSRSEANTRLFKFWEAQELAKRAGFDVLRSYKDYLTKDTLH